MDDRTDRKLEIEPVIWKQKISGFQDKLVKLSQAIEILNNI